MNTLRVETVKINSLSLDPTNARRHDRKNLTAIEGSLKLFGQRKPIVVTGANIVVAGNGTLEAAKNLGWTEISIVRTPRDWTPEQVKAYALADNRTAELAEWDAKVLADQLIELDAVGWDIAEFGFEPIEPPTESEDDEPLSFDDDKPTRSKLGDHWVIGKHHIICGDSTDVNLIQKLNVKFDAVITDPPYGIDIVKNNKIGSVNLAKPGNYKPVIGDNNKNVASESFQIIQNLDSKILQCWWGANHYSKKAQLPDSSCWLIWDKINGDSNFADAELAWTNHQGSVRIFKHMWNGMLRASERGSGKRVHPTQKPIALTEWIIKTLKIKEGSNILDLFAGSGSTLLGAEKSKCNGYGIELDPFYVDVIIDRLEKETGLEAELLES